MRPLLVAWLVQRGAPAWLAPDYFVMVALGTVIGCAMHLRLARRDGSPVHLEARALAIAYVGALVGGPLFEWLRAVPEAIAIHSWAPVTHAGRAAYGGLLGGALAAWGYLRWRKLPVTPFFDHASVGTGVVFAFVRTGCFLAGCDYGRVTGSRWGVRFPAHSLAAMDHANHGWIPPGVASLPVHATELYEAAIGVVGALVAWRVLSRGAREGRAFLALVGVYAAGRFAVEGLRGDETRGVYGSLSTAQYVSLVLVTLVAWRWSRASRSAALSTATALVLACIALPQGAFAQGRSHAGPPSENPPPAPPATPCPPGYTMQETPGYAPACMPAQTQVPQGYTCPPGYVVSMAPTGTPACVPMPPTTPLPAMCPQGYAPTQGPTGIMTCAPMMNAVAPQPPESQDSIQQAARGTVQLAWVGDVRFGRTTVPSGSGASLLGAYRIRVGQHVRFEVGLEGRGVRNSIANQWTLGLDLGLYAEAGRRLDLGVRLEPLHTWIAFDSPFFTAADAWGMRFAFDLQVALHRYVTLGVTPLSFSVMNSQAIGSSYAWEPGIWLGAAL